MGQTPIYQVVGMKNGSIEKWECSIYPDKDDTSMSHRMFHQPTSLYSTVINLPADKEVNRYGRKSSYIDAGFRGLENTEETNGDRPEDQGNTTWIMD
ncbi:hypothetical protein N7539_006057 [Penicillium diatomitis]|uniref:Uncharacterized protein n=1 Tax=Penicillium diatomitis TaxID=2819901 RepID=A0A9W9X4T2_9EURO|nr:uncharacterized protein N7539_006057 [Penicillium diatomitis]KAJ5483857.1 hypothetical protein N7539_006057 [Penicillium diatomitis]